MTIKTGMESVKRTHEFFDGELSELQVSVRARHPSQMYSSLRVQIVFVRDDGVMRFDMSNSSNINFDKMSIAALLTAYEVAEKADIDYEVEHPFKTLRNLEYELCDED